MNKKITQEREYLKLTPLASLKKGLVVVGFASVPEPQKTINSKNIEFFDDFPCVNLGVRRKKELTLLNSDDLVQGDVLLTMGRLKDAFLIQSDSDLKKLQQTNCKLFLTIQNKHALDEGASYYSVRSLLESHKPLSTNLSAASGQDGVAQDKNKFTKDPSHSFAIQESHRANKLTKENHKDHLAKLQDGIEDTAKTQSAGVEVLSDLFYTGNIQPRQLKGVENVAQMICSNVQNQPNCANVLMLLKDHDDYTFRHSVDVANQFLFVLLKMQNYGEEELKMLTIGALMHDIGKSRIPPYILNKPGLLDAQEWKLMKLHPIYSAQIMKDLGFHPNQIEIGLKHHVKKNNSGYPEGISYYTMSDFARLAVIADVFQALVTKRAYKKADNAFTALKKINLGADDIFDSRLVELFIRTFGVFPIGSLVRLSSGESGFVINNTKISLRPAVVICIDTEENIMQKPHLVDLSMPDNLELEIVTAMDHRIYFPDNNSLEYFMNLTIY